MQLKKTVSVDSVYYRRGKRGTTNLLEKLYYIAGVRTLCHKTKYNVLQF